MEPRLTHAQRRRAQRFRARRPTKLPQRAAFPLSSASPGAPPAAKAASLPSPYPMSSASLAPYFTIHFKIVDELRPITVFVALVFPRGVCTSQRLDTTPSHPRSSTSLLYPHPGSPFPRCRIDLRTQSALKQLARGMGAGYSRTFHRKMNTHLILNEPRCALCSQGTGRCCGAGKAQGMQRCDRLEWLEQTRKDPAT